MPAATFTNYHIDDLVLNTQLGSVHRNDQEIALPQLSYKMLCALVAQAPAIVSQDDLMALVWGEQVVSDETLKQRIKLLRQALGDTPQTPKYIESVRGRGYRCIAEVKQQTIKAPVTHDSINLRLQDRLPVSFMRSSNEYWRLVSAFFVLLLTVFISVMAVNDFSSEPTKADIDFNQPTSVPTPAQQAYNKGRKFYLRYQSIDNEMAIKSFLQAIKLAPDFALAYAGLADAYSQGVFQFSADGSWQKKALEAAYDAVMLNDQQAQNYKALGTAHYISGHLSQSLSANLKAVTLQPSFVEAQANLGYIYSERGELKQALKRHKLVQKLNPEHHLNWFHLALTYTRLGQLDKAKPWYQKMQAARPNYHLSTFHFSHLLQQQGEFETAKTLLTQAEQLSPDSLNVLKGLAELYLLANQIEQAKPWVHKLKLLSSGDNHQYAQLLSLLSEEQPDLAALQHWYQQYSNSYTEQPFNYVQLAIAATALGNPDHAFRHLTQAVELGWLDSYYIQQLPFLASLKQQHKFARIIELISRKTNS